MASCPENVPLTWSGASARPAFVDDLGALDAACWDRLAQNFVPGRHALVRAMDEDRSADPRYCVIADGGRYLCVARVGAGVRLGQAVAARLFGGAATPLDRCRLGIGEVVVCGWPLGRGGNVMLDPTLDEVARVKLMHEVCAAVESRARERTVVFPDLLPSDDALAGVLAARGYLEAAGPPVARLDIEWSDLNGYLSALRRLSKNAYSAACYERKRYQRSGAQVERLVRLADDYDRICELLNDHHERLNGESPGHTPDELRRLRRALGDDLLIYISQQNGEILGAAVGVRSGTDAGMMWIGIDHAAAGRNFTYFNLAYYGTMDDLCRLGVRRVWLGNAAYEAKLRRGCRVASMRTYLRPPGTLQRFGRMPLLALQRRWYARKFRRFLEA